VLSFSSATKKQYLAGKVAYIQIALKKQLYPKTTHFAFDRKGFRKLILKPVYFNNSNFSWI